MCAQASFGRDQSMSGEYQETLAASLSADEEGTIIDTGTLERVKESTGRLEQRKSFRGTVHLIC